MSRRSAFGRVMAVYTSPRLQAASRSLAEWRRRLRRAPHLVSYFHQVDDPYSQLVAQVLAPLLEAYEIELMPVLVGPPDDGAAPERERLVAYARKDAADIAPHFGLEYRDPGKQPSEERVLLAQRILAAHADAGTFAALAVEVGRALWADDAAALAELAASHGTSDSATALRAVAAGDARRRKLGHYLAGTLHYGGEWYWGVDRIGHLEDRLRALGIARSASHAVRAPEAAGADEPADGAGLVLELFASVRSPYSYLALERIEEFVERTGVELVLRPVLPMVMRGLPVPAVKRLYIVRDTKREAQRAGLPFGRVADPVGEPVERVYSLYPFARAQGRGLALLRSFTRAAFAEGIDTGTDAGLRQVVLRAGLRWEEALAHLGSDAWRDEIEANREAMLEMGLWGVPSFRLSAPGEPGSPSFCTWGQDRLWLIEEKIRTRLR